MNGRFVWYELMTTDPQGAIAFYSEVIGWKTQVFPGSVAPEPYTMWLASQGPLGGVMTLPEEAKKHGAPPHWMANVTVDDLDAALAIVTGEGGKVFAGPMDVPEIGRVAVIADPQGAVIAAFQPAHDMAPHDPSKHGEMCWNELLTTDAPAALRFYGKLFGWKVVREVDLGEAGTYYLYGHDEQRTYGGMMTMTPEMRKAMPAAWLYYVRVDDLDAAIARAKAKGARLLNGPMEVPDGTRIAHLMDPQGAAFALNSAK